MKKLLFLLLCSIFMMNIASAQFNISGKLTGLNKEIIVFLMYGKGENFHLDSTITKDKCFTFLGTIKEPIEARLFIKESATALYKKKNENSRNLYLENGLITVNGETLKSAMVKGGEAQQDFNLLQLNLTAINKQSDAYYEQLDTAADKVKTRAEIVPKYLKLMENGDKLKEAFITSHKDSYVSLSLLGEKASKIIPSTFAPFYNGLSERMKNTTLGKSIGEKLTFAYKLAIGQPASDFTQNNTDGKPVSLSSLKGKYVLIDFWASWCVPCRKENPGLKKTYAEFKDRNFQILAVSIDSDKYKWLEAIKQDDLQWLHVSDLLGAKNAVINSYGVRTIPQNVLIDPKGIIVAKNLMGDELNKKLAEILK